MSRIRIRNPVVRIRILVSKRYESGTLPRIRPGLKQAHSCSIIPLQLTLRCREFGLSSTGYISLVRYLRNSASTQVGVKSDKLMVSHLSVLPQEQQTKQLV
jgi:hypothetical protein